MLNSYRSRRQFLYVFIPFWSPYDCLESIAWNSSTLLLLSCINRLALSHHFCLICLRLHWVLEGLLDVLKHIKYTWAKEKKLHFCASSSTHSDLWREDIFLSLIYKVCHIFMWIPLDLGERKIRGFLET